MVEVGMRNPLSVIEGKAPDGGGEVDMNIAFQIPSERVDGQEDAGQEAPLGGELFDEVGGKWGEEVKKMAIDPEEGLQWFGECPGDMLPDGVGEGVEGGFDPVVSGFFATGGTETGFAGMWGLDASATGGANEDMPTKERRSADKHLQHIDNNRLADKVPMGQKEPPPVAVVEKKVSEFDEAADEFHRGRLSDFNAEERKSCCPLRAA